MRYGTRMVLLIGIIVSLAISVWSFRRLSLLQDGVVFAWAIFASSLAAHCVAGLVSVVAISRTRANATGAGLRILTALLTALFAGYLWLLAYGWARSFGIHGDIGLLPSNYEEARFLNRTDSPVATLSLLMGMLGSLLSSVLAASYVRRDVAWFVIAALSLVSLMCVFVTMFAA